MNNRFATNCHNGAESVLEENLFSIDDKRNASKKTQNFSDLIRSQLSASRKSAQDKNEVLFSSMRGVQFGKSIIKNNIEYYFFQTSINKDKFLMQCEEEKDPEGFIKISTFLTFPRMRNLSATRDLVLGAVFDSDKVVISDDGLSIKRSSNDRKVLLSLQRMANEYQTNVEEIVCPVYEMLHFDYSDPRGDIEVVEVANLEDARDLARLRCNAATAVMYDRYHTCWIKNIHYSGQAQYDSRRITFRSVDPLDTTLLEIAGRKKFQFLCQHKKFYPQQLRVLRNLNWAARRGAMLVAARIWNGDFFEVLCLVATFL